MQETRTSSPLKYLWNEPNPWFDATKNYFSCYERYFNTFNTFKDLNDELKRPDVNTICKKELDDLRKAVSGVTYKQVLGKVYKLYHHTQD